MNRQALLPLSIVLFPLVTATLACTEEDPVAMADAGTDTGDAGDEEASDAQGPTVEIMLDDEAALRSAGELKILAEAEDPSGVDAIEFYLDDELVAIDASAPYRASVMIPDSSFNGERTLIARAYDANGNMSETAMPLTIELPDAGTVEWEYIGPGGGKRWVLVGSQDTALVIDRHKMLHISTEGELLSSYEFSFDVSAVTQDDDGVIALGSMGETLAIQRFGYDAVPLYLDLIDDFGAPGLSISDVAGGDGRLVISSVSSTHLDADLYTARISSVVYGEQDAIEWHRYLVRESQVTDPDRTVPVAMAPSGRIYTTPTFEAGPVMNYLQLRGFTRDGDDHATFEQLVHYRDAYFDIVASQQGVFAAGRLEELAAIERFDADGNLRGTFYMNAGAALAIEPVGDELAYASVMPDASMKIGRVSANGAQRWTRNLGGGDIVRDIAVTSVGHMYVVSEWDQAAWRLRRVHP